MTTTHLDEVSSAANHAVLSPFRFSRSTDDVVRASRILIVDDEPAVSRIARKYLQDAGFHKFEILEDCRLAGDHILRTSPDLVLLDIHMEPVNGLQILESVRNSDLGRHIPIVVLTSSGDEMIKLVALNLGANDFLRKPVVASELVARVRNTLSIKAYHDQVVNYSLQLESDVLTDALTGIPNRRAFDYELKRRMSEWKRQKTPLTVMMIDIDHFKQFNDRYGHAVGDAALRHVATVLKSSVRDMDLVARFGGEEFAVILPATDGDAALNTCAKAQMTVSQTPLNIDGQTIVVTISVGMAVCSSVDDADLLMRRADTALYAAKQNGRNCSFQQAGSTCVVVSKGEVASPSTSNAPVVPAGNNKPVHTAKVIIVDDEPATTSLARKYLRDDGFSSFVVVNNSVEAFSVIEQEAPDLILLDLRMPEVDGMEILKRLRSEYKTKRTPVIVFTATRDMEDKVEALNLGANDFLEKPLHARELLARVHNTLMAKAHIDLLANYSSRLEYEVQLRTTALTASRREAVQCLARAAEMRDDITGRHVLRVGRFAAIIARELGFSEERVNCVEHAAQLHDVGKIGVPDAILHKPDRLTSEEYEVIKGHCIAGHNIIRGDFDPTVWFQANPDSDDSFSPLMKVASIVAATHHEKWDGTGYPRGLKGDAIPIEGRITAVADVFDALSTQRPYKTAMPIDECFRIIEQSRGSHFDPTVLDAFLRCRSEIIQTAMDYADPPAAGVSPRGEPIPGK